MILAKRPRSDKGPIIGQVLYITFFEQVLNYLLNIQPISLFRPIGCYFPGHILNKDTAIIVLIVLPLAWYGTEREDVISSVFWCFYNVRREYSSATSATENGPLPISQLHSSRRVTQFSLMTSSQFTIDGPKPVLLERRRKT